MRRFSRRLWVRATAIALLGLIAAWSAPLLSPLVPQRLAEGLGGGALVRILEILASSMLAVTTFSLAIMVQARQAASTQVTPRSHRLVLEDTTAQTVLATFLGSFVFALVSLIAVSTGFYGARAAAIIMVFTLLVIGLVVIALLRWIDHLSDFGSVLETSKRVEDAAREALEARRKRSALGARPLDKGGGAPPPGARIYTAERTGYVLHVDLVDLSRAAEAAPGEVHVLAQPGTFVAAGQPVAHVMGPLDPARIEAAVVIDQSREFAQDPRFGLVVLGEIAQRALSPGLNDPGTAIDIIGRLVRLLCDFGEAGEPRDGDDPIDYPRVWMPPLLAEELVRDGFAAIARDGAGMVEVGIRLQKGLAQIARAGDPRLAAAARAMARRSLTLAEGELVSEDDRARIRALAERV